MVLECLKSTISLEKLVNRDPGTFLFVYKIFEGVYGLFRVIERYHRRWLGESNRRDLDPRKPSNNTKPMYKETCMAYGPDQSDFLLAMMKARRYPLQDRLWYPTVLFPRSTA